MAENKSAEHDDPRRSRQADVDAAHVEGELLGLSGPAALPAYPGTLLGDSRLNSRGNGPVKVSVMQRMQQTYGNRAVQRFLASGSANAHSSGGSAANQATSRSSVQRATEATGADMYDKLEEEPDGPADTSATAAPGTSAPPTQGNSPPITADFLTKQGFVPVEGTNDEWVHPTRGNRVKGPKHIKPNGNQGLRTAEELTKAGYYPKEGTEDVWIHPMGETVKGVKHPKSKSVPLPQTEEELTKAGFMPVETTDDMWTDVMGNRIKGPAHGTASRRSKEAVDQATRAAGAAVNTIGTGGAG